MADYHNVVLGTSKTQQTNCVLSLPKLRRWEENSRPYLRREGEERSISINIKEVNMEDAYHIMFLLMSPVIHQPSWRLPLTPPTARHTDQSKRPIPPQLSMVCIPRGSSDKNGFNCIALIKLMDGKSIKIKWKKYLFFNKKKYILQPKVKFMF